MHRVLSTLHILGIPALGALMGYYVYQANLAAQ
jgi:hypothetical protein